MRLSFALALAVGIAGAAFAQPSLTPAQRKLNIDSFELVWKTVLEKHWDPKLNGVDWQAVHDELLPKVEKAATMDEVRDAMREMLGSLKQTHFGIVPGDAYQELDEKGDDKSSASDGDPGIDVRQVDGHTLVTFVTPGSPAEAKGVKPGWEVLRIDGKELTAGIAKVHKALASSAMLAELIETRSVEERMEGPIDKTVDVEFLDGKDHKVKLKLSRARPRGTETVFGMLPPVHFWVDSHKVGDVGYIRFNMFFLPDAVANAVQKLMNDCHECKGFVIDLRGTRRNGDGPRWMVHQRKRSATRHHVFADHEGQLRRVPAA